MKNRTGELRELFAELLNWYNDGYVDWHTMPEDTKRMWRARAGDFLKACKEKGLAFVVDRELPDEVLIGVLESLCDRLDADKDLAELKAIGYVLDILKAGCKPTEEIDIEENTY